jgi:hypothetical protein
MKNTVFWDVTSYILLDVQRIFGGLYYIHLQDRRVNKAASRLLLLCLLFRSGDLDSTFFRNVGKHLPRFTV